MADNTQNINIPVQKPVVGEKPAGNHQPGGIKKVSAGNHTKEKKKEGKGYTFHYYSYGDGGNVYCTYTFGNNELL